MRILAMISGLAILVSVAVTASEKAPAAFQQAMKDNSAAMQKLGKDADAKDYDAVAAGAAAVKAGFMGPITKYWTDSKNQDGIDRSKVAASAAEMLETAAKAKNDMGIADARKAVTATCGGCHTAHREKTADGSFEIK